METFLQILQHTMKILAIPGRLSTILMAHIKIWTEKYNLHGYAVKVRHESDTTC